MGEILYTPEEAGRDVLKLGRTRIFELIASGRLHSIAGFVAAGRHLTDAKGSIPHGDWEQWVRNEIGISQQTAHRLMALAQHPVIANHTHVCDLPPSWGTLYELSRLEPPLLEAAIEARRVHPDLERDDARKLVIEYKTIELHRTAHQRDGHAEPSQPNTL